MFSNVGSTKIGTRSDLGWVQTGHRLMISKQTKFECRLSRDEPGPGYCNLVTPPLNVIVTIWRTPSWRILEANMRAQISPQTFGN